MEKVTKCRFDPEESRVYEVLDSLGIPYVVHEHPPVFTVEEATLHWANVAGAHCKNLFLRNIKGSRHYLVVVESSKRVDLKALAAALEEDKFSFGSDERLKRFLGLTPGSVSPFGLINDARKEVEVVIDEDLKKARTVNFHPNVNTATIGISFADFERFLAWSGQRIRYLKL